MGLFSWIVVGIIGGWLGKLFVPGEGPAGLFGDLIVGVLGAILGGWIWHYFGRTGVTGINLSSIIIAFAGSVILLVLVRLLAGKR